MAYTRYDFTASLERVNVPVASVRRVIAAWGTSPGFNEWSGGFLLETTDGRTAYVTGWCDTSGWGCQDGADIYYFASEDLDRAQLPGPEGPDSKLGNTQWDEAPADLNLMLKGAARSSTVG